MKYFVNKNEMNESWSIANGQSREEFSVSDLINMLNKLVEENPDYADAIVTTGNEGWSANLVELDRKWDKSHNMKLVLIR